MIGSAKNAETWSAPARSIASASASASSHGTCSTSGTSRPYTSVSARHAAERGAVRVRAVVGELPRDHDVLVGLADRRPVGARELSGGVDRLAAAGGEEDLDAVERHEPRDPRGQLLGLRRREAVVGLVRGELAHLRGGGVGELGPAVADVAVPERAGDVDQRVAGVVPDGRALAAHDRDPALAERADVRHRVPERALRHVGDAIEVLSRVPWWLDEAPPDPEARAALRRRRSGRRGRRRRLHRALDGADAAAPRPGAAGGRARGGARRLRAERAERRLPRDVLVRARRACALGSATRPRSRSPTPPRARSPRSRNSARTSGSVAAGCSRSRPRPRRTRRSTTRSAPPPSSASRAGGPQAEPGISPVFRRGVRFPDAATVQPARLVRALRRAALAAGVDAPGAHAGDVGRAGRGRRPPRAGCARRRSSSRRTRGRPAGSRFAAG